MDPQPTVILALPKGAGQFWIKWRQEVKGEKLSGRLLKTQLDRIAGVIALEGQVVDVISFVPDPTDTKDDPTAKVTCKAYKAHTEPLEAVQHTFYVPLTQIEGRG